MGEANRKRSATQRFLAEHPICCFCGGGTQATTRDHIPGKQLFALKRRPSGLEFPACYSCNQASKHDEEVAAFMTRFWPEPTSDDERKELVGLIRKINKRDPQLLAEMQPNSDQLKRFSENRALFPAEANPLNAEGPSLNDAINRFAKKLTLGMHYESTGRIIPPEGGIAIRWFSNFENTMGGMPDSIIRNFDSPQSLRQGKWNVESQFMYDWRASSDGSMSAHFSTFRSSFAIIGFAMMDRNAAPDEYKESDLTPHNWKLQAS